jgi:hypothetical protein
MKNVLCYRHQANVAANDGDFAQADAWTKLADQAAISSVVEVLGRSCSCGCCRPIGEGMGVFPESPADMTQVRLTNGEETTLGGFPSIGDPVYFHSDEGEWYLHPPQ